MPTYDYVCKICGHEFEAFHGMNVNPIKECPKCGSEVERKISGGTGLVFKGSGFYITDYKNKKTPKDKEKKKTSKKAETTKE